MPQTTTPKRGAGYQPPKDRAKYIIGAIIAILCVGIIGGALYVAKTDPSSPSGSATPTQVAPNPDAPSPKNALPADSDKPFAINYSDVLGVTPKTDAPTVTVWEDFQCPACAMLENAIGKGIVDLAKAGDINLIVRPTTFLDRNLNSDASARATAAWGVALDAGYGDKYRELLFVNHPAQEGDGWTNEQLVSIAREAGATEAQAADLQKALTDGTYREWAANTTQQFYDLEIPGTPHIEVNGTVIDDLRTLVEGDTPLIDRIKQFIG